MRVLILGGDGYLGWPTAMHLSAHGHKVVVVDNYLRRQVCEELDIAPLYPVPRLHDRARRWHAESGYTVNVHIGDLCEWEFISGIFESFRPEAIVHYAEQPSAPYSMLDRRSATLTLQNNISATANMIFAVREFVPDAHIIKLGTMGEYGTPDIDIEEGWIDSEHKGRKDRFLYPRQAGSLYHTTKIMDTDLLWFYVRTWNLRVTDLMQGPVYGVKTAETNDPSLRSFLNYDEIFGTVLNRFVVQAIAGYPLTVYGAGEQTRGYLNIIDTMNCIRLSVETPADKGELRIFNQVVETFSVNELAGRVAEVGKTLGIDVTVNTVENPRKEREEHYYNPVYTGLKDLGLEPHPLTDDSLADIIETIVPHKQNIREDLFLRGVRWA